MEQEKETKEEELSGWVLLIPLAVLIVVVVVLWNMFSAIGESDSVEPSIKEVAECLSVPSVIAERLNSGLNINGGGSIRNLMAVKSTDFESVYFISGDLQGSGLEGNNDIATFATNKLDYTGMTLSVDAVAVEFSDWPDVSTTNLGVSRSNKGYSESRKCVSESQ